VPPQTTTRTTITVVDPHEPYADAGFCAITVGRWASGDTPAEAIQELFSQFKPGEEIGPITLRRYGPDEFFGVADLREFNRVRDQAQDKRKKGIPLTDEEGTELESWLDRYYDAVERRSEAINAELGIR
jgi:hypothetical protein